MDRPGKCAWCGKTIHDPGAGFCPYCGKKRLGENETPVDEIQVLIRKADECTVIFERAKLLSEARKKYPNSREIEKELLFIGDIPEKKKEAGFFCIRCYNLELYLEPKEFSKKAKQSMRLGLFSNEKLKAYLDNSDDRERDMNEYLYRLCREFTDLFLLGSNRYMQGFFGIRSGKKPEKLLAGPMARMILNVKKDEELSEENRKLLSENLYLAFSDRFDGRTEFLDALLGTEKVR